MHRDGPSSATRAPCGMSSVISRSTGRPGTHPNDTPSNRMALDAGIAAVPARASAPRAFTPPGCAASSTRRAAAAA